MHPHLYGRTLFARVELDALTKTASGVLQAVCRRAAIGQHGVAVEACRMVVGCGQDVRPVDEEHRCTTLVRVLPVLHDEVPVPHAAGVRRLEQQSNCGGVVECFRIGPLQQNLAGGLARRVGRAGRIPIDATHEVRVVEAVGPIEDELAVNVEGGVPTSAHQGEGRAVLEAICTRVTIPTLPFHVRVAPSSRATVAHIGEAGVHRPNCHTAQARAQQR